MNNYTEEQLKAIHKKCTNNRESLEKSDKCGCFYCLSIFNPNKIKEWARSVTAICPCMIDSILASHDMKIDKNLLEEMHERYFSPSSSRVILEARKKE